MGHGGAAPPPRAITGQPDNLAAKGALPEDFVAQHLRVVHGAVIEVKPECRASAHAVANRREAWPEHGEEAVAPAPRIFVRMGTARFRLSPARFTFFGASRESAADVEGRVE